MFWNLKLKNDGCRNVLDETLAYGYSSESNQRELSNEYQHAWLTMVLNIFDLVLWTTVASALEGLMAGMSNSHPIASHENTIPLEMEFSVLSGQIQVTFKGNVEIII